MDPDEDIGISVVIVTWNSAGVMRSCLESLQAASTRTPLEVIVVDNASHDETLSVVRSSAPTATVIANSRNLGLAAGNNQGLAAASYSTIVIANPDIVVAPDALEALADVVRTRPRVGMVIPQLRDPDGSLQASVGDFPGLLSAFTGGRLGSGRMWWPGYTAAAPTAVPRGAEACYLVRGDAVADVGPQDERFPLDWEGIDWSERFRRAGWEVWFQPAASVVHIGGVSIRQAGFRWVVQSHLGLYRYFAKRSPLPVRVPLALAVLGRALVKILVSRVGFDSYKWARRGRSAARRGPHEGT